MQFGIKVPGILCGTPGCRWDVNYVQQSRTNNAFPPTHETAPLFLYKHVILATHSLAYRYINIFSPKYIVLTNGFNLTIELISYTKYTERPK